MASAAPPATPQRPVPGNFINTPAPQQQQKRPGQTIFGPQAESLRERTAPLQSANLPAQSPSSTKETQAQKAAKSIDLTLQWEEQFPQLENYVTQGISGEYEQPKNQALQPFQEQKTYEIPQRVLAQMNHVQLAFFMGIFAPLGHAWIALDNCLYLWDYTATNPDIIGYEDASQPITAIRLVPPKPGVFVEDIKHMIVVCTQHEMLLLGTAKSVNANGAPTVNLYDTKMKINISGINVTNIVASKKTGRIFFSGDHSDDIYEFHYQQEEGWFSGKCQRINHTSGSIGSQLTSRITAVGSYFAPASPLKSFKQMVIDDSRNLLWTLSKTSEIRVWHINDPNSLTPGLMRPLASLLQNAGGLFQSRTDLLTGRDVHLVSLSVLSALETSKLALMASTNTGCRLYLSVTRGYGYQADAQNPPSSIQILHIRFPARDPNAPAIPAQSGQTALAPYQQPSGPSSHVDSTSTYLLGIETASRFPPGYWMAYQRDPNNPIRNRRVFCVATDTGRLKMQRDVNQTSPFTEHGQWIAVADELYEIAELTDPFGATNQPVGFGNELAVQFDEKSPEFAIVTASGIQTIRRRRLVDMFASLMKYGSKDDEGTEGDIKRFIRTYGRGETAATALAVACGQGVDMDGLRIATVSDPEVLEKARKVFIDHGGSPEYNANAVMADNRAPEEDVKPSPRYEGISIFVARLARSVWRSKIIVDNPKPGFNGPRFVPGVKLDKLKELQRYLTSLLGFLDRNRSFIDGMSGPSTLSRVKTRQEEIALRGEHSYMHGMLKLIESINEGISFVVVLFDERIEDILALLHEESRRRALALTFQALFVSPEGRDLAKELVKAIVNRNISNGSNVDTVAEALRRRCGSFCSADDVVIFKAQEAIKRATETGTQSDGGRALLNESQRLFQKCAASLSDEYLKRAVEDYVSAAFYAGAIQLCLTVANEKDKAKRAWAWMKDGALDSDPRRNSAYEPRRRAYELIFAVITHLDAATANAPELEEDGKRSLAQKRRTEAYDIINNSDDYAFLTDLYDFYITIQSQPDRLLAITNPFVVEYLRKKSSEHSNGSRLYADLLWRYFSHYNDYLQAATVQLDLARCDIDIALDERIEYLSLARANASTRQTIITDSRQSKQRLLREVSDLLDIAEVQQELLERLRAETRIQDPERKQQLVDALNGHILPVERLFMDYAEAAKYHDICILLYKVADHRNPGDIKASWMQLIRDTSAETIAVHGKKVKPWEAVGMTVHSLGRRLGTSPSTFPVNTLLPLLEEYAIEPRQEHPPDTWAIDIMLDLEIPAETLLPVVETMYYSNAHPWNSGSKKRKLAEKMVYVVQRWYEESERSGERVLFGSEENLSLVMDCLNSLARDHTLGQEGREGALRMMGSIRDVLR
ncbi:hypothetical protein AC578_10132 [Pseudocercospora eumusae]|uniref:Nucleoporin Nup133/Nup155-like N-terminal domain-containing protein n=1 Tax=Pseudocercospora eumusae TaxID=321146 RepID=A0A139HYH6_9PEZI|nr:hypothetical protein AC578_10132 [Pseudocercospora eumusae]